MKQTDICGKLTRELPSLFECSIHREREVRVHTPLLFPDGGLVDVFVTEQDGQFIISDYGDALSWLRMQSATGSLTPNQQSLIDDVRETLGIERHHGQLELRDVRVEELADAVSRLAQAVVRVADIWYTFRTRSRHSVADEVNDWLREQNFDVERSLRYEGKSGRSWQIDFSVTYAGQRSSVFLLSTGSKAAARQVSEHVFTGCSDLRSSEIGAQSLQFISLFDDTLDVWRDEDFNLLQEVSKTAYWSRPDELASLLRRTAARS